MSSQYYSCHEHTVPSQHIRNYARSTARSQEEALQLAIKQYTPKYSTGPQPGDVTVIAAHASGFVKELYEPLWDELYKYTLASGSFRIRNIWIADIVNQGASGILNEGKVGNDPSWFDHARDHLCIVNHFRDLMPRPLVGFGHSMGATTIINLALLHPRLLSSVVAVEPILNKSPTKMNFAASYLLTFKPDVWPSREEAMAAVNKSPPVKTWDQRVKDAYYKHAFRDLPTPLYPSLPPTKKQPPRALAPQGQTPVTLTTTKHQEALSYGRSAYPPRGQPLETFEPGLDTHPDLGTGPARNKASAFYRPESGMTFAQLRHLRPSCFYIYGSKSHMHGAQAEGRGDKLAVTGKGIGGSGGVDNGAVRDTVVEGATHFLAFERLAEVAGYTGEWLGQEMRKFRDMEAREIEAWDRVDVKERSLTDEDWRFWMKEQFGRKSRQGKSGGNSTKL